MNYERVRDLRIETRHRYTARDTILYALGVGVGIPNPTDPAELAFVYEKGLRALPTMAVVLAYPGFWMQDPKYAIRWERVLHGEQSIALDKPLPCEAEIVGITTTEGIYDKGAEKGAIVYTRRDIYDEKTGDRLASVTSAAFLRGDGGFGGVADGAPKPPEVPGGRAPDHIIELATRPEQALIYRLSGDLNPLHADPLIARQGGFAQPILHGLCTYGIAGRAVLAALCEGNPDRLKRFGARFSSPVYPGETLAVSIWRGDRGQAALEARVTQRDSVVLRNGWIEFTD